jgi:hypothetical protein
VHSVCLVAVLDRVGITPIEKPEAEPERRKAADYSRFSPQELATIEAGLALLIGGPGANGCGVGCRAADIASASGWRFPRSVDPMRRPVARAPSAMSAIRRSSSKIRRSQTLHPSCVVQRASAGRRASGDESLFTNASLHGIRGQSLSIKAGGRDGKWRGKTFGAFASLAVLM